MVGALGSSLLGAGTAAAGPTGAMGKGIATNAKWGQLGKGVGAGLLIGGLTMAIADGMEGYAKAEDWGVSKFSATFGTALAGADSGLSGMFKNAGKFALIGAGLGSVFPVVGTVIGGAIGALLGGLLGFFGGEKIAKALDDLGKWVSSKVDNILKAVGLKEKTKEDHIEDIETKRKIIENQRKSAEAETQFGHGRRFRSVAQKRAFLSGLDVDDKNLGIREESVHAGVGNLDTGERASKLRELKENLADAEADAAAAPAKIKLLKDRLQKQIEKYGANAAHLKGAGAGSIFHTNQMVSAFEAQIKKPQQMKAQIAKLESLYTGGRIATGGIATLHPGEEVLEAAEITRIERALSGQTLNAAAMNRIGLGIGGGAGMGAGSTVIDNSVTNMSNTTITPMITRGQMLPGETNSIRPRAA